MKKAIWMRNAAIVLFAVLFLFSAVMTILALLPEGSDVEVCGTFTASPSELSRQDGTYLVQIQGYLRNTTDEAILLEGLTVRVEGLDQDLSWAECPRVLEPRMPVEVSFTVETETPAEKVEDVRASVRGSSVSLRNPAVDNSLQYAAVPLLCTVVFLVLLVRSAIVRYYLAQEAGLDAEENAPDRTESE